MDTPPAPRPPDNLRVLPNAPVFLFETVDDFSTIKADAFIGRVPGNSVIVCKWGDRNATLILDRNGRIETTY